jgi:hypothetical protein
MKAAGRLKDTQWWLSRETAANYLAIKFTGLEFGEVGFKKEFMRYYRRFYSLASILRRVFVPPQKRPLGKFLLNLVFKLRINPICSMLEN